MNKGYKYYKSEAKKGLKSLKGFGIVKYNLWIILSILASILIIPIPLVVVMNVRLHKNMVGEHEVNITESLEVAGNKGIYRKTLKSLLVVVLLFLSVILFASLIDGVLLLLGMGFVDGFMLEEFFLNFFLIPGALFVLIFLIALPFIYIPVGNVIDANPNLNVRDILRLCLNKLKYEGKGTLFLNLFLMFTKINIIYAIFYLLIFFDSYYIDSTYIILFENSLYVIAYIVFFFIVARIIAKHMIISTLLYEDILVDNMVGERVVSGVNLKVLNKSKTNNILASLFSDVTEIDEIDTIGDDSKPETSDEEIEKTKKEKPQVEPKMVFKSKTSEDIENENIFNRLKDTPKPFKEPEVKNEEVLKPINIDEEFSQDVEEEKTLDYKVEVETKEDIKDNDSNESVDKKIKKVSFFDRLKSLKKKSKEDDEIVEPKTEVDNAFDESKEEKTLDNKNEDEMSPESANEEVKEEINLEDNINLSSTDEDVKEDLEESLIEEKVEDTNDLDLDEEDIDSELQEEDIDEDELQEDEAIVDSKEEIKKEQILNKIKALRDKAKNKDEESNEE